jgi:hypothetical protein
LHKNINTIPRFYEGLENGWIGEESGWDTKVMYRIGGVDFRIKK